MGYRKKDRNVTKELSSYVITYDVIIPERDVQLLEETLQIWEWELMKMGYQEWENCCEYAIT